MKLVPPFVPNSDILFSTRSVTPAACGSARESAIVMKTKLFLATLLALLVISPTISNDNPPDPAQNAALWYWRAIAEVYRFPIEGIDELKTYVKDRDLRLPATLRERILESELRVDDLRRGAALRVCSFAFARDRGINETLIHVEGFRICANMLVLESRLLFESEDSDEAVERLTIALAMARHIGSSNDWTSALVGLRIFQIVDEQYLHADRNGQLNMDHKRSMLKSIKAIDKQNPFHLMSSLEEERELSPQWFIKKYSAEGGRERFEKDYKDMLMSTYSLARPRSQGEFVMLLEDYDRLFVDIIKVFNDNTKEDSRDEILRIMDDLADGDYGIIAQSLAVPFEIFYDRLQSARKIVSTRIRTLKEDISENEIPNAPGGGTP